MSVIADIDANSAAIADLRTAAVAYLAATDLPVHALLHSDALSENARDDLDAAITALDTVDRRDNHACLTALYGVRDAMTALDVAIGLAPGAPPLPVRWWRLLVDWAETRQEARR